VPAHARVLAYQRACKYHANTHHALSSVHQFSAAALEKRDHEVQALLWAFAGQAKHSPVKSSSAVSFHTLAAYAAVSAVQ